MALEHAILVALAERAGSGYELARRFDKSIGFFYGASHQQIYRTLKRMDGDGWISCETVPQQGRPDKKVYSVGADGRVELRRWLAEPSSPTVLRDELSLKIRGASHGDLSVLLEDVRNHRTEHQLRLQLYRQLEAREFPDPGTLSGMALHQYLVQRGGIVLEEGLIAWYDEILTALHNDVKGLTA
ncbi:PadR family transcriptional regulator [Tomitella biformata]|uniref:PadR family transcriptional regulator n=1 Tax=Tomitella biformata TaxID=630403 RepID=UPI00046734E0|nr:PadR family transcriptional regulator [Tomitella biformata]